MHVLHINTSEGEAKDLTKYMESKIYPNTHNTIVFTKAIHLARQLVRSGIIPDTLFAQLMFS